MKKFVNFEKDFPTGAYTLFSDDLRDEEETKGLIDYFNRTNELNYEKILSMDLSQYKRIVDLRANNGILAARIKKKFPQCTIYAYDIKQNYEFIREKLKGKEIFDSVNVVTGNILNDEIPAADLFILPHLLMEFNFDNRKRLLQKLFKKMDKGGKVIIVENLVDEERKDITKPAIAMSFIFGIENYQGYALMESEYRRLLIDIGFSNFEKFEGKNGVSDIITVIKE
jgi:SAM-dependent methyltransferase